MNKQMDNKHQHPAQPPKKHAEEKANLLKENEPGQKNHPIQEHPENQYTG